ncbi:MAG: sulfite exporter TauE/SafE family protein [Clostridiales Family XIII bacterium]|jgi:sulfite exporter TauE/SafE/copper chaperone CopZ|nr:sulfite exporter TauE/SafE family protein [Clostridiales Family XIII bacterium]
MDFAKGAKGAKRAMKPRLKKRRLRVGGMTCANCRNKIERKLRSTAGVAAVSVSYGAGTADVTYDADIVSIEEIISAIRRLDYSVPPAERPPAADLGRVAGILAIIISLYILLQQFGVLNLLVPSRLADAGMGYGMLLAIGFVTSLHCVAMCGGINLSQSIPKGGADAAKDIARPSPLGVLRPALLYNLGRVSSYTAIGFVLGFIGLAAYGGADAGLPAAIQGILKIVAGALMVIMGINMLGIIPALRWLQPRMPRFIAEKIDAEKARAGSPFIVGLLNGLMPCGPLQSMQIVALASGNPFVGALSMFIYSLGTVPLMLGLGGIVAALGRRFASRVMNVGAVLVVVLGLAMLSQGGSLSGLVPPDTLLAGTDKVSGAGSIQVEDGKQVIGSTLAAGRYPDITVRSGIPVKWVIDAPQGSINGCNNRMVIQDFGIEYSFKTGENIVEFTPSETGRFGYSCWMGMIRGTITVVEPGTPADAEPEAEPDAPPEPKQSASTPLWQGSETSCH